MVAAAQQTLNELCLPVTVEQLTAIGAATLGAVIFIFAFMRKGKGTAKEDAMSFEVEYTPSTMEVLNQLSVEELKEEVASAQAAVEEARVIAARFKLEAVKAKEQATAKVEEERARAKWERVQAWREAERLNRILNTMIVAAGAEARTKAHTDESLPSTPLSRARDRRASAPPGNDAWKSAAQAAEAKRIAASMMEKGLTLGMKGQPRKTFPQFIPKGAQLNSETDNTAAFMRFHRQLAVAKQSPSGASPQLAYKVAHDATPQLSWLMTSETESEDASV